MNVLIVESPNKIKKISKILGTGWKVVASVGHVCDLPKKEIGVEPPDFIPRYVVNDRSKKTISSLKLAVAKAHDVYLATDPDREGEAISWHLEKLLNIKKPIRVSFQEITKNAVFKALESPGVINYQLVRAQEARRVLDRLVGYLVSPALSNIAQRRLSAGRVQSVALRLVVEREREIENFVVTHYFVVRMFFEADGINWFSDWDAKAMLPKNQKYLTDDKMATQLSKLRDFTVIGVKNKETKSFAPPPFTTSTLQQAASVALKINPKQTMQLAQKLFEEGLITYHRSDSCNLSADAIDAIRKWLTNNGFGAEVPQVSNTWSNKANSQEAHEAIRPTDIENRSISIKDPKAEKLYKLIWERTVASQMEAAIFDVTVVYLLSVDAVRNKQQQFISKGRVLRIAGWLKLTADKTRESDSGDQDNQKLPVLNSGDRLTAADGKVLKKETKPPPRYTEAALIKKLDNEGIGRPSTYAGILDNINTREYIDIIKRLIHATELGKYVNDTLVGRFNFMELQFTKDMELILDKIAVGQEKYATVIAEFYRQLHVELEQLGNKKVVLPMTQDVPQHSCPQCHKPLRKLKGKSNKPFWGCSGYPACKTALPDNRGVPGKKRVYEKKGACPECGAPMVKRSPKKSKKGNKNSVFWGCSTYPKCKAIVPDLNGEPGEKTEVEEGIDCGECGKPMVKRKGKNGLFWGCTGFPRCKNTLSVQHPS